MIGLPGDRVTCCNALGRTSVNGVPLDEPCARVPIGLTDVSRDPFTTTVPAGAVWGWDVLPADRRRPSPG